ncbi:pentapeptide repeat-containing protein [Rickettsiella endosymbiont of Miltochrista miniata]|uniref:pentapeptide repeat-containing protein n=1 Tax=Rickettsiella endosymbiont of Miltochrista miniata TaxID=3066239 RepID=UPI00313B282B
MKNFNRTAIQLNLNSIDELQNYLQDNPPRTYHAISNGIVSTLSFPEPEPEIAAQLFKKFLVDLKLKDFKGWNLTTVNFAQIDTEISMKNNKSDDFPSVFSHLDFSEADLAGVQLSHLDFSGSNFTRARLKFANLSNVNLNGTSLVQTDFSGADLFNTSLGFAQGSKAKFKAANLINSSFHYGDFSEADFTRVNLTHSFFLNINLTGAYLVQADLSKTTFMWSVLQHAELFEAILTQADLSNCDLSAANLEGAYLMHVNLRNATLNHARLQEAVLMDSDLRYAKLNNSNLVGAKLENANLSGAQLNTADCQGSIFAGANLTKANLDASNLQHADLSRAILKGASLKYANLADANFRGANLEEVDLEGANITRMNLQGAHLQGVLLNGVDNFFIVSRFFEWENLKRANQEKYPIISSESQKSRGEDLAERCLPLPAHRSPPFNCEISWEAIENYAFRYRDTCDVKQIVVSSREFLWSLSEQDPPMQSLWLQLVDTLNISGPATDQAKVRSLIHYEKLAPLLLKPMQNLEMNARQLSNDPVHADSVSIPAADFSSIELLNTLRSVIDSDQANRLQFSFNTTLLNLNTISFQALDQIAPHPRYTISFDFLSNEIRAVLGIIQSISIYKWPSATQFIFSYHLKPGFSFNEQQMSWLRGILNTTQYSQLSERYLEIFKPCQTSCFNLTLVDRDVIRHTVVNLINPSIFAKPIENFTRNLTSILPNKTVLHFKDGMKLMLDDKKNRLGYAKSNQSVANIIQTYVDAAHRLNITLVIANHATRELITIGYKKQEAMQNDLVYKSHLFANGDEKNIMINSGTYKLNITQFPLPDVVLTARHQAAHSILDFRNLAQQIKQGFNTTLQVAVSTERNDLILKHTMLMSNQQDIPVISIRLQDALIDRAYKNLQIISNTAPTKIVGRGFNMHLQPFPLQLNATDEATYFVMTKKIEANTAILIPRTIDQHSFFRNGDDLVLTNAFSPLLEINRLCNVVLHNFYQESSKAITCSLEFINKKIILRAERAKIFNATETWSNALLQHKEDLYAAIYKDLPPMSYAVGPRVWPWGQPSRICYSRYRRSINLPAEAESSKREDYQLSGSNTGKHSSAKSVRERAYDFYDKYDQMKVKHAPKTDKNKPKKDISILQPKLASSYAERQPFTEKPIHMTPPSSKSIKYDHHIHKRGEISEKTTKKPSFEQVLARNTQSKNSRQFFSASHKRPTLSAPLRMAPMLMDKNYKQPFNAESSIKQPITHQYSGSHTKQPAISRVSAPIDVSSNLFAVHVLVKLANRGKYQPAHSSTTTTNYQKIERQSEKIQAKIYKEPRMERIEIKAQGFNLR